MFSTELLTQTPYGFYCPVGDFYIDGQGPIERTIVTHGHSDHAYFGPKTYFATPITAAVMRHRLGEQVSITELSYGQNILFNGVTVSLHPAGHIPGSAQVRIEYQKEVVVVAGDFKRSIDGISTPFEVIPCHTFVTESTFALPIYHWPDQLQIADQLNSWWQSNQQKNKATVIFAYSLGKAQRVLHLLHSEYGPIFCHGAVFAMNQVLSQAGLQLPDAQKVVGPGKNELYHKACILAPPSAYGTPWLKKFEPYSSGVVSGWMTVRGRRRSKTLDRGFPLSDHADWPSLLQTIQETGAQQVIVKHGYTDVLARYLTEMGISAVSLGHSHTGELEDEQLGGGSDYII